MVGRDSGRGVEGIRGHNLCSAQNFQHWSACMLYLWVNEQVKKARIAWSVNTGFKKVNLRRSRPKNPDLLVCAL